MEYSVLREGGVRPGRNQYEFSTQHSEGARVSVQRPALMDDFLDKHLVAIVAPSTILIDLNEKVNQSTENIAPGAPNS